MINKSLVLMVLLMIICLKSFGTDEPTSIYTPLCTLVGNTSIKDEFDPSTIAYLNAEIESLYPNAIRLSDASRTYNCHAYAWYVSEGGNHVWIGYSSSTAEDIFWNDGSYVEVGSQAQAEKISYASDNHSAITTSTPNWFISKWGSYPLMNHAYNDCPYSSASLKYYSSVRTINGNINSNTYKIGRQIKSSGQVAASASVNFQAGKSILLTTGFKVQDAYFQANIVSNCWPNGILKSAVLSPTENSVITSDLNKFSENKCLDLDEKANVINSRISVYPIPVKDILFVEGLKEFNVIIYDINGRLILSSNKVEGKLNVAGLKPGIYIIHLCVEGKTHIQKIVKQ